MLINTVRPVVKFGIDIWPKINIGNQRSKEIIVFFYFMNEGQIRWISVVEFHDPTLGIGKIFGQESTVVKWNYQILGLPQVTVDQKLGVILVRKWFRNWSQQKMLFTKKVRAPKLIFFTEFFLERCVWFLK